MKPYAAEFYSSTAWKKCRAAYKKKVGGLCERCIKKGKYKAGEIVHHKIYISEKDINNPEITLNFDNLELVCRDCHGAEHGNTKRYEVDAYGRVTVL